VDRWDLKPPPNLTLFRRRFASVFTEFPFSHCSRLRIASTRQVAATSWRDKSSDYIIQNIYRLRFASAFVELRRDKPTRRAGEL